MNSVDYKLVYDVAEVWVDGGGDEIGIDYLMSEIRQAVINTISERDRYKDECEN